MNKSFIHIFTYFCIYTSILIQDCAKKTVKKAAMRMNSITTPTSILHRCLAMVSVWLNTSRNVFFVRLSI